MNKNLKVSSDKSMIEEGVMLINKGLHLGIHAQEELDDPNRTDDATGIGCYMLAQSIELLIKGMCFIFGCTPPDHHIIKHSARLLLNIYNRQIKELYMIQEGLIDISDNSYAYTIQTWQKLGRYDFLQADQDDIDKAEVIYNDLKRFILSYQLNILD